MIKGRDKIREWLQFNNCTFWRIKSSEKGFILFKSSKQNKDEGSETFTANDAITELDRALNMLQPGYYFIEASYPGLNENSWFKNRIEIPGEAAAIGGGIMGQQSGAVLFGLPQNKEELQAEIGKLMDHERTKEENIRLKQENAKLKDEIDGLAHRVTKRLEPFIEPIVSGLFKGLGVVPVTSPDIAGIPDDEADSRLQEALKRWAAKEPELIQVLEAIATMAETNPGTYQMARKMLLQ